jgi:hypothetical protein
MFGPDTSLVVDAIQIGLVALGAGVGGTLLFRRFVGAGARKSAPTPSPATREAPATGSLEDRVRVLERIATDRPGDLAEQIEALRDGDKKENA